MNYFERFKLRWNIQSNKQLIIVFCIFGITGFSTLGVKKLLLPIVGITTDTPLYLKIIAEVLIILPAYQVLLIIIGSLLGQYRFFKSFLCKMLFISPKKLPHKQ